MQFSVYQESQLGGRKVNQDRMGYSFTRDALLLVLADGMGGHLRGEMAAAITLQTMSSMFQQHATPYVRKPERFLEEAFLEAHDEIHRYRIANNMPDTPRTTVVACLIQHNTAIWAHCGDSRLYWLRRGQILGRTRDHSHIEHLIAQGLADPAERATHPDRNKLYNCIGASSLPKIEVSRQVSLLTGDVVMLCSDGLWSMLPDEEIVHRLSTQTIVRAIPDMISTAITIGGDTCDNTTALAIMWQGSPEVETAGVNTDGSAAVISTMMLPENLVSTTILSAPEPEQPLEIDAFNDDEIEKAIAEIRDAIEKSSQVLK
ncbi:MULTISPECIES: PP2C family protein-serine/threonine phosphatase [Massilia]|jgi:protein phosphatase|uniref:Serine/threonine-protein phosphatase n=3 Tax=Massilia TaxID=149698 RepID=A0ABY4A7S8_9BURK|nr:MULTISPECIES: PP2C family serine/threonine-protein phosphatase [Massilia]NHZ44466.1 serine/threonine-protein phosphatase [Massilia aquatica]NHZ92051.1 SpoIIE family protein phosphatase [Massilia mucilaginosa]UOD30827.1 serine/threonine-protein phosphatase [Massilia violaceinigra]